MIHQRYRLTDRRTDVMR